MFTLRDYQAEAKPAIRDALAMHKSTIAYLATGGGKTVMALDIVMDAIRKGGSVLFLAPRKELIEQPARKLLSYGFSDFGCIKAGHSRDNAFFRRFPLQIASPQTMRNRIHKDSSIPRRWRLVVVDECHRDEYSKFLGLLEYDYLLGLSATPYRTDGRGLAEWFKSIVTVATADSLTKAGRLKPMDLYWWPTALDLAAVPVSRMTHEYQTKAVSAAMDVPVLRGDAIAHWKKYAAGKQTLLFASSVEHAKNMVEAYEAAGVGATYVDGSMNDAERGAKFQLFENRIVQILANYDICTTGYDCPGVECIQLLRPVKSHGLWRQMLGRGTRPKNGEFVEDGEACIVLDHALCTQMHGLFTDPDRFSLEGSEEVTKKNSAWYSCPECGVDLFSWPKRCPNPDCRCELPRDVPEPKPPLEVDATSELQRHMGGTEHKRPVVSKTERETWALWSRQAEGRGDSAAKRLAIYREMSGGFDPPPSLLAQAGIKIVVSAAGRRVCWASQYRDMDLVSLAGYGMQGVE